MSNELLIQTVIDEGRKAQIEKLRERLDWALDNPMGQPKPVAATGLLGDLGTLLWEAAGLDAGQVSSALDSARDEGPLRIVVSDPEFFHWPWELLYHAKIGFLGQHAWCVIIRRSSGKGDKQPISLPRPFRLLLFIASPEDLDAERNRLDYEHEEELLFTALDRPLAAGEVVIDVAEDGCLPTLLNRLKQDRYHAVILSMHGTSVTSNGVSEGFLLFEDPGTWHKQLVSGSQLERHFEELPADSRPGLVVLSACRSARLEESGQAITSVAEKIHRAGIERVLGMRLSVMDSAAAALTADLFGRLVDGVAVGRAVSLARRELAAGKWWTGTGDAKIDEAAQQVGDLFAQWTLPVLLDRTADGPLVDRQQTVDLRRKPPMPELMNGDDSLPIPPRATFIGRRREIRQHLRPLVDATQARLFITGPGGVGKTTLAGRFTREMVERLPNARLLGFRAPFDLAKIFEFLRSHVESDPAAAGLLAELGVQDEKTRIAALLHWLATRADRPLCVVLDNLESLQELSTLAVREDEADSLWLLRTVCALPQPTRVLLTGRYAIAELAGCDIVHCPLPDAPYGDVLRRMNRLAWPDDWDAVRKRSLYKTLGGNHRALEWLAELLQGRSVTASQQLMGKLERLESPPDTPEAAVESVLEEMRANLLLEELLDELPAASRALLHDAALYREPVTEDGLAVIQERVAGDERSETPENRGAGGSLRSTPATPEADESARQALLDRSLLEYGYHPLFDLTFYEVPPIVRGLLREPPDRTPQSLRELHRRMAGYHEFQGRHVTRQWNDDLEAVYHYRLAAQHADADRLAEPIANFYYRTSQFTAAVTLIESLVERTDPLPPWWALNRFGMCQLTLGQVQSALDTHQTALSVAPDPKSKASTLANIGGIFHALGDYETALSYLEQSLQILREIGDKSGEGTTLNNISQIFKARGDYETALSYLEQSLQIRREIGDKSGEGTTLNNISQIYDARGDYETALSYLEQSLQILREIGDKSGEGTTLNNISQIYDARGDYETALSYLEQSLQIRREIGDKSGEGTTLNNISQIYDARGDYETALSYLEQSLQIRREIGDKSGEGTTLNNISQIYDARGDYETALSYLEQSLQIRREIGDKKGEGTTLNNISQIYDARGDYETALSYLEQSLQISREIGDKSGEGTTLNNMSAIAHARGDYETALSYLEQSLQISREIGDKSGMTVTLHNMAHIALANEDGEKAMSYWGEALQLAVETGNAQGIFHVAGTLGTLLAQSGGGQQAASLLQMAIDAGRQAGFPGVEEYETILQSLTGAKEE